MSKARPSRPFRSVCRRDLSDSLAKLRVTTPVLSDRLGTAQHLGGRPLQNRVAAAESSYCLELPELPLVFERFRLTVCPVGPESASGILKRDTWEPSADRFESLGTDDSRNG